MRPFTRGNSKIVLLHFMIVYPLIGRIKRCVLCPRCNVIPQNPNQSGNHSLFPDLVAKDLSPGSRNPPGPLPRCARDTDQNLWHT